MQLASEFHRSHALGIAAIATFVVAALAWAAPGARAEIGNPQLSAGVYGTCAISPGKRLYCWGSNSSRQLGLGSSARLAYGTRPYPVKGLKASPAGISSGYSSACATLITGSIACWGKNSAGQLGVAKLGKSAKSAQAAAALISPWVAPSQAEVGQQHLCIRDNNQTVKCLGANAFGQLGNATNLPSAAPVQVAGLSGLTAGTQARQVVTGANHACARLANQNVKCWGVNNVRQLGTPTNSVPWANAPVDVPNLSNNVTQLASTADHTCAIHAGGGASCWGADQFGQLGDGSVAPFKGNVTVAGLGGDAKQISTGIGHSCALITGGAVRCWGSNEFGQLGNGTVTTSARPVSVIGLSRPAAEISAGGYHTCARLDNGEIYCWGRGSKGQLGGGRAASSLTAKRVAEFGGVHFAGVKLSKAIVSHGSPSARTDFVGALVALPARAGRTSRQCRTNAHLTVSILQDGVTRTKKLKKRLRPSGKGKCSARFSVRALTRSASPAQLTLKGSYRGTPEMPAASFTQVYPNL